METLLAVGLGVLVVVGMAANYWAITTAARKNKSRRPPWYVTAVLLIVLVALMVFRLTN